MIHPEINETYRFRVADFDTKGRRKADGETFRNVVKTYERDFHTRHTNEYAINLYANSRTMHLLQCSCDADPRLMYGMELTQATSFDPTLDPDINHAIDKASKYILVYGIDSAFMTEFNEFNNPVIDEERGIYPLTLLIDNTISDGTLRLSVPTTDEGEQENCTTINTPKLQYV